MEEVFIEAESFGEKGGWVTDSQSMEAIHSAYIMAHGMGIPVKDAKTKITVNSPGKYSVWALTRNWSAVWNSRNAVGIFKVIVNGAETDNILGSGSCEWQWQKAGEAFLKAGTNEIALRDLTGFNARCDALYLTTGDNIPPDDIGQIDDMRKRLNWKKIEEDAAQYDLIVSGGGISGICFAISAMRAGLKVLLIQDRAILGGCNSSEVRVPLGGQLNLMPYPKIGNIVKEISPVCCYPGMYDKACFEDKRKELVFKVNENGNNDYTLLLNERVTDVEADGGNITAVISTSVITGKKTRRRAKLFADCTGDATIARLGGARTMYGREAADDFNETLAPEKRDRLVMGHSIQWYSAEGEETTFPDIDWGIKIDDETCLDTDAGSWEQETGFRRNMVSEIEYIRDYGLCAIYANWAYQKNHFKNKEKYKNRYLRWVSPIGGKRESYRVVGEHILTQGDVEKHIDYNDKTACITWSIDMHFPEYDNEQRYGEAFRSFAYHRGIEKPYAVPYRCLYSADIKNLFLGGRSLSCTHVAFSCIRVMRTLGQLAEAAGIAAGICKDYSCLPSDVYHKYLDIFKQRLADGVFSRESFACPAKAEEKFHFKDIGWLHFDASFPSGAGFNNPEKGIDKLQPNCTAYEAEKFKRNITRFKLKYKNRTPDLIREDKDES